MNAATSLPNGVATHGRALDDDSLLSAFLKDGDQSAFKALAARHAGWVYAAAYRQLRDSHAAEDATQAVLILLTSLAVIALLAFARGNPGDGGRFPDRDAVVAHHGG